MPLCFERHISMPIRSDARATVVLVCDRDLFATEAKGIMHFEDFGRLLYEHFFRYDKGLLRRLVKYLNHQWNNVAQRDELKGVDWVLSCLIVTRESYDPSPIPQMTPVIDSTAVEGEKTDETFGYCRRC